MSEEPQESVKRGRKPCPIPPGRVRDLRLSSNRLTWKDVAKRLRTSKSTARRLWYTLPVSERRVYAPKSSRPWWLRTRLKKDPILNRNLYNQNGQGYKVCCLNDPIQNKIWACGKTLPVVGFQQAGVSGRGVFLRSLCKACMKLRKELPERIEALLIPKHKHTKKRQGRPRKVTQDQIDFLVAAGMNDQEMAERLEVSRSTVKRIRLSSSKRCSLGSSDTDWSNPVMYKKGK